MIKEKIVKILEFIGKIGLWILIVWGLLVLADMLGIQLVDTGCACI